MISFDPLIPVWLLLTALAGVCFVIYRTVGRKRLRLVCWLVAALLGVMIADPVVTVRRPDSKNGGVALLVDSSASMQVPDADGKTRLDAANAFADRFLRRFGDAAPVTRYAFDYRLTPGEAAKPEFAAHWRGAFAKLDELHGAGALSAAVVLSDGGDVSGWRPGGASAPVFAVKFGTELGEARNASLGEFRVPETVRADSTVEFPVPVTLTGYDAPQKLELKLLEEGQVIQAEQFELAPGATETVKLKTEPVMAGLHRFSIELSSLPDEVTALDNRRAVAVDAEPDARFTLISFPRLSAGFRPLVRYFTRVRADFAALYPAGAGGGVRRIGSRAGQAFEKGIPDRAEALKPVGVLILGDFDEAGWSAAQLAAVEAYVEQGGTLVLLGGADSFRVSGGAAARLLPFIPAVQPLPDTPLEIAAPEGSPFAGRLNRGAIRNLKAVESLKPGTTVLLQAGEFPLAVAMPYGRGQVAAVLSQGLPLWGKNAAERDANFGTFWAELTAYLGRSASAQLQVELLPPVPLPGETVTVRGTPPPGTAEVTGGFTGLDGRRAALLFSGEKTGVFTARTSFADGAAGELEITAAGGSAQQTRRVLPVAVGSAFAEPDEVRTLDANFRKVAAPERIYSPADLDRLVQELRALVMQNAADREFRPAFETPYLIAAVLLLAALAWLMRRKLT